MTKFLIAYWITGCMLFGANEGLRLNHCHSHSVTSPAEVLVTISIWPMIFGMVLTIGPDFEPSCGVK